MDVFEFVQYLHVIDEILVTAVVIALFLAIDILIRWLSESHAACS
jgi:hypothetical protein